MFSVPGQPQAVPICVTYAASNSNCHLGVMMSVMGVTIFEEDVDLTNPSQVCPTVAGCAGCLVYTKSKSGAGICLSLTLTCGSTPTRFEVGCFEDVPLAQCLPGGNGGGICNCHGNGKCDDKGKCTCDAGWEPPYCATPVPDFSACKDMNIGKIWHVCGKIYASQCEVIAALLLDGNKILNQVSYDFWSI